MLYARLQAGEVSGSFGELPRACLDFLRLPHESPGAEERPAPPVAPVPGLTLSTRRT